MWKISELIFFNDPVGEVRKRLQRLMNLAEDRSVFARHPLDRCVFMSFNGGDLPKSVSEGMERLDGILGLHVDDFIGGGEGMSRMAVEGWNHVPVRVPNFASRVKWLKTKLELGSLHLGLSFPFTGIQLTQLH